MTDERGMPQYDGMEYEELVAAAQFLWMENAKLRELVRDMCDLLPYADWLSMECDDRASACIDQAIELGIKEDA